MKKKTFRLADLVDKVNERNRLSTCSPEVRKGWNSLCESLLLESDVYAGFNYLSEKDVPKGHEPGIRTDEQGNKTFPDESRVFFYPPRPEM